jgi:hypothetical protein
MQWSPLFVYASEQVLELSGQTLGQNRTGSLEVDARPGEFGLHHLDGDRIDVTSNHRGAHAGGLNETRSPTHEGIKYDRAL